MKNIKLFLLVQFLLIALTLSAQQDSTAIHFTAKHKKYYYQPKGYFGRVDLDVNFFLLMLQSHSVYVVNGYKFNQYAQLGAGIGVDYCFNYDKFLKKQRADSIVVVAGKSADDGYLSMPIDLYFRGEVGKRKVKFYYTLSGGISIPLSATYYYKEKVYDYRTKEESILTQHHFFSHFSPSFGILIPSKSRFNFSLGVSSNFSLLTTKSSNYRKGFL